MFGIIKMKELTPSEQIQKMSYCVFDLETTGGNQQNDKIIEIGLVKIKNFKIVEKKNYLIQPEINIPSFIHKLTSLKQADVEKSPLIEDVIDEILEFMKDSVLVAHNTSFDIPFFNSILRRLGKKPLKNKALCTHLMTKYLMPNLMNSNLNYMCRIFNIKHQKAHRALDDAMATAKLLIKYLNIFISKDIQKLNHLYYPRNKYELDQYHFKRNLENPNQTTEILCKLSSVKASSLVTLKGVNGVILYSLPFTGKREQIELIEQKVKDLDWRTLTIKLY